MAEPKTTRIVLLGKTGSGKSSLANTIFGEKRFNVSSGFESVTSFCEAKTKSVNGRKITLIDSPGFFDTNKPEEKLKPEIAKCITECSPGPHAFLIVLKVERFTDQEEEIIQRITKYFSEEVYKFATVVFTHGDDLPEGEEIKNSVKQNKSLSDFVKKCGGRCHVIDNKHWNNDPKDKYRTNKYQVGEILKSVEDTVKTNKGKCYTNDMLKMVEEIVQQEEKHITESSEKMSEEEIRREAKQRVIAYLNKAAGITVGMLLGALFGAALPVALVAAGLAGQVKSAVGAVGAMTGAAEAAGAAAGAGTVAAGGVGFTTGVAVVGVSAAVGAGLGGIEGYQAAQAAKTPSEAAEKAAGAVFSKGMKAIKGAQNLASQLDKEGKYTLLEEKSSKS